MLTGSCLSHAELRHIIDSVCGQMQLSEYERHINSCDACCRRLEEISGTIPRDVDSVQPTNSSNALSHVMAELLALDPTSRNEQDTLADAIDLALPYLSPSTREGSLGRIGSFEVRRVLGRGGMGIVFAAVDPLLNREVAIKVPSTVAIATQEDQDRFIREARAIASVKHDNIVTVYAADNLNETPYLVMELVQGESLAERLRANTKLPWKDVLRIGQEVVSALDAAHGIGVVHRDVTPANILLESDTGRAKVTDFGLAKSQVTSQVTATGVLAGTPAYMSPEQAAEGTIGTASDLFSLGVVLYEACTGVSPFRSATALSTLRNVCELTPTRLHELNPEIPEWFSDVVHRLMAKDPADRPRSTTEAQQLLLTEQKSVEDGQTRKVYVTSSTRRKIATFAIAASIIFMAAYVVVSRTRNSAADNLDSTEQNRGRDNSNIAPNDSTTGDNFYVTSTESTFATFEDALRAAASSDVIEVQSDGPFAVDAIVLDKAITIRANAGIRPVFRNKRPNVDSPFIRTQSDLQLEGLEIEWTNLDWSSNDLDDRAAGCIISAVDANIQLFHCRLIVHSDNGCLGCNRTSLELINSHFVAPTGTCVVWVPPDDGKMIVRNCVFEGERTAIVVSGKTDALDSPTATMTLQNNSFSVGVALNLMMASPMRLFDVISQQNAFDALVMLRVMQDSTAPKAYFANGIQKQLIFSRLNWTESQNAYLTGTYYIKRGRAENDRPQSVIESSLSGWLSTFSSQDTDSFETDFVPVATEHQSADGPPNRFAKIRIVPSADMSIGADLSRVGPENRMAP